jgi:hypothetical protein
MFGRDWEKASGTVIERRITSISKSKDGNAVRHEYVVEVLPQDRPDAGLSRVVIRDPHIMTYNWLPPGLGEEVAIEMHPRRYGSLRRGRSDAEPAQGQEDAQEPRLTAKARCGGAADAPGSQRSGLTSTLGKPGR